MDVRRRVFTALIFLSVINLAGAGEIEIAKKSNEPTRVAFLWIGADGGESVVPKVNADFLIGAYEKQGFRVFRADALEPEGLFHLVQRDRRAHPLDYRGTQIHFIVHGKGAVEGRISAGYGPRLSLPPPAVKAVRDHDLITAFVAGIGPEALGEIIGSICFSGVTCEEVDLSKTPYIGRVARILVAKPKPQLSPEQEQRRVLGSLLDTLVDNIPPVGSNRRRSLAAPMLASQSFFGRPTLRSKEDLQTPTPQEKTMEGLRSGLYRQAKRVVQGLWKKSTQRR